MAFSFPLFGYRDLEKPFKWSLALHFGFIIFSMIGLPNLAKKPLVVPQNIVVDLVAPSELTAAPNTTKEKPAPKPVVPEKPKPAPKSEPPKTIDAPKIEKPKPVEKTESKPEPVPSKKVEKKKDKPLEKKEPPKEKAQAAQPDQFSSLLKNLVGEESTEPAVTKSVDAPVDTSKETGIASTISDNLTMSQADALKYQLASCWNIPIGARDAENLVVEILATVGPDRIVKTTEIIDKARYSRDPFYRTAAESARRALLNPKCSPLALPEDKYELWKTMRIRFNPKEMFGG